MKILPHVSKNLQAASATGAAATRVPATVNTFGSTTVIWEGAGNYHAIVYGYGLLWQLTQELEGSINTRWLALPIDALAPSGEPDPALLLVR